MPTPLSYASDDDYDYSFPLWWNLIIEIDIN